MKQLLVASRPASWINTALPFLAAALAFRLTPSWALILGFLYFLGPYNLLLYGVNDLFDYESDRLNPRKGGLEGGLVAPSGAPLLIASITLTNLPLLGAIAYLGGPPVGIALGVTVVAALAYSVPPARTKVIPVLDSVTSASHFVLPAVCGLLVAGLSLDAFPWRLLAAFALWAMASQALGAIQDVGYDRQAGIGSIATAIGERGAALFATTAYSLAIVILGVGGGLELVAAAALLPYVLLAGSCLGEDPAQQARRAWRGFMAMNLLAGFVITQLYLRAWGWDRISILELLAGAAALGVLASLGTLILNQLALRRAAAKPPFGPLPAVSVIVTADGPPGDVGRRCASLLRQAYPGRLELIVVTAAATAGCREEAASVLGPDGVLVVAGPTPEGWTDRCWAADRGAQRATGELLAFVGAPATLAPQAMAEAVSSLRTRQAAMVSLLPGQAMASTAQRALLPAVALIRHSWTPIFAQTWARGRWAGLSLAFEPCLLVTRSAYRISGGHQAIAGSEHPARALARAVASAAGPVLVLDGTQLVEVAGGTSTADVRQFWRRSHYHSVGNSLAVALAGAAAVICTQLLPLVLPVLAVLYRDGAALAASLVALVSLICLRLLGARWDRQPLSSICWHPVTWVLTLAFQLESVGDGLRGRVPVRGGSSRLREAAGATTS